MTLNETVSIIRDVARVNLRLLKVNELRAELLCRNNSLDAARNAVKDLIESSTKASAVASFKMSQLNTTDPEFQEKTNQYQETVEREAKRVTELKADLAREESWRNTVISEITKKIEMLEDGSTKVCKDDLQIESVRLLKALGKQNAEDAMTKAVDTEF